MKKIIKILSQVGTVMLVFGLAFQSTPAHAAFLFNARSEDCNTTSVINDTTGQGFAQPCWSGRSISVRAGEEFTIKVYARNTGTTVAPNVALSMTDVRNAVVRGGETKTFSGRILANGSSQIVDNVSISFVGSGDMRIELVASELEKYSNGTSTGKQALDTAVYGSGVTVYSSMPADLGVWVTAKAKFKAVAVNGGTNDSLSVSTDRVQILDDINGDVRFTGSYATNQSSAEVHFNYRKIGGNSISTIRQTRTGSAGSFTADVNGLSRGNYEFQACAKTSTAQDCGTWKSFSINGDDRPVTDGISAVTGSYQIISAQSGNVELRGSYSDNNDGRANVYIEYRNINGGSTRTIGSTSYSNTSRSFSGIVTGLSTGTYEYRACASNNSSSDCGSWREFSISRSGDNDNDRSPSVTTLAPIQIFSNAVAIDGYYSMNGCSGSTWFEYGRTQSFGSRTPKVSRGSNSSGSMAQSISELSPGVTYYYRAVGENCNGTTYGSTLSFVTSRGTVVPPKNNGGTKTVIKNIGAGANYVRLMIDNGRDSIMKGDDVIYDVYWENITKHTINNLVLEVALPEGLQVVSTDQGQLDRSANKVYVNIKKLEGFEKDDMTIRAKVVGTTRLIDGDAITARAILAFENPEVNQAQENAIAYDSDTYFVQKIVASGIFGGTFLPATLAGWLLLILLLIIVIILLRYAVRREEHHHYYPEVKKEPTTENNNEDYIPYRPTPKE